MRFANFGSSKFQRLAICGTIVYIFICIFILSKETAQNKPSLLYKLPVTSNIFFLKWPIWPFVGIRAGKIGQSQKKMISRDDTYLVSFNHLALSLLDDTESSGIRSSPYTRAVQSDLYCIVAYLESTVPQVRTT